MREPVPEYPGIAEIRDAGRPARAVMFYPWGDLAERSGGASLRCNLLLDFLAPRLQLIRVLQSGDAPAFKRGNIEVEAARKPWQVTLMRRAFRLLSFPLLGRAGFGQELYLWHHLDRLLDPAFRRRVREMVRGADIVLLEYSFWAHTVLHACREFGVPCVLTQHDVLADQVAGSALLRRLTSAMEAAALRRADHATVVSAQDAAHFAALGITAHVVANPADLARVRGAAEAPRALLHRHGFALPPGPICFFVGSRFAPNIEAADRIRCLACAVPEAGFVVAGGCAHPERSGNFAALGTVPDEALAALYAVADLVLAPLPHGGGSSLKTIEAMAAGKAVLGTRTAFRGLPVVHGEAALIEDNMGRWPELIRETLTAPSRRASLAKAARILAEEFDAPRVFQAYLPLLGLP
jgi:glycosyltransferase involved in cell wall biosynthesis